jgi:isoleucyl-tRNA synthetase
MGNAKLWDNIKFDLEGVKEVQRIFFGTLFNPYNFFTMYSNIDEFTYEEKEVPIKDRSELDRWIMSALHSLIEEVTEHYNDYDPTKVARTIQNFVIEHLSNWYVRLSRRKFWKGDYDNSKIAAYQTLYRCLEVVAQLMAPLAPFYADRLFQDLNKVTTRSESKSVHLTDFPVPDESVIDKSLEERMQLAQEISSLALSLRKKEQIKVRQPLNKLLVPVQSKQIKKQIQQVEELIMSEVNIGRIEYVSETTDVLEKQIKPNFKELGPKLGDKVKAVAKELASFEQEDIQQIEQEGIYKLELEEETIELSLSDVEITSEDMPGWLSASTDQLTVALDISITEELEDEGKARELVNRIQKVRKKEGLAVTDRIKLQVENKKWIRSALSRFEDYICRETLATDLEVQDSIQNGHEVDVYDKPLKIAAERVEKTKTVDN